MHYAHKQLGSFSFWLADRCIMAEMMLTRALFTGAEAKGNELQQDQLIKVHRSTALLTCAWPTKRRKSASLLST